MKLMAFDLSGIETFLDSLDMTINLDLKRLLYERSEWIISNLVSEPLIESENKGILTLQTHTLSSFVDSINGINEFNILNLEVMTRSFSIQSEILLEQGMIFNVLMLHKNAIEVLSQAIKLNSSNREAYFERALAYFETNQIALALKDYEKIKQLSLPPFKQTLKTVYIPKHKTDFAKENKIMDIVNVKSEPRKFPMVNPRILRSDYQKMINGQKVEAVFESNLESGEIFLKDAWVITK